MGCSSSSSLSRVRSMTSAALFLEPFGVDDAPLARAPLDGVPIIERLGVSVLRPLGELNSSRATMSSSSSLILTAGGTFETLGLLGSGSSRDSILHIPSGSMTTFSVSSRVWSRISLTYSSIARFSKAAALLQTGHSHWEACSCR